MTWSQRRLKHTFLVPPALIKYAWPLSGAASLQATLSIVSGARLSVFLPRLLFACGDSWSICFQQVFVCSLSLRQASDGPGLVYFARSGRRSF